MPPLEIFISYASEDQKLVDAVVGALNGAFPRSINISYMSEFQLGTAFRDKIDDALDKADIILAIASGRPRLTFTFTGYEVGYFRKSQRNRPLMREGYAIERVLIPFAILTELPSTISTLEGIEITEEDRPFVLMNERGLADNDSEPVILKLLLRIDHIIDSFEARRDDEIWRLGVLKTYKEKAQEFNVKLYELIRLTPIQQDMPKTKIMFRVSSDLSTELLDQAEFDSKIKVFVSGPTRDIFPDAIPQEWISWDRFVSAFKSEREVALNWVDRIANIFRAIFNGDFSDSDQLVLSHDSENLFRLFVSKSILFYDQSRQVEIYVLQVPQSENIGDPFTSYLGRALEIALRYRSLFLELDSPFTPIKFRFANSKEIKGKLSSLLRELRILFVQTKKARLVDNSNIVILFGHDTKGAEIVNEMTTEFETKKVRMTRSCEELLKRIVANRSEINKELQDKFIEDLDAFCVSLSRMNGQYLDIVIKRLQDVVKESDGLINAPSLPSATLVSLTAQKTA